MISMMSLVTKFEPFRSLILMMVKAECCVCVCVCVCVVTYGPIASCNSTKWISPGICFSISASSCGQCMAPHVDKCPGFSSSAASSACAGHDVEPTSCACPERSAETADSECCGHWTGASCGDTSLMQRAWSCVRWLMSKCCVYHNAALSDTTVNTSVPCEVGHARALTTHA